ncbi:hypothetical protein AB0K00_57240 [Dactylosporangium sp. NPDC049525]|uniref:hypothetical protein n=1 Tax=Dactylosporangium sp. NPDC049525 TaxID=3154730 RepID=UPI003431F1F6
MVEGAGVRSGEALAVLDGEVRGFFPPGRLVFPVAAAEVVALDAAVRSAAGDVRVVGPEQIDAYRRYQQDRGSGEDRPASAPRNPLGVDALRGYVARRFTAFERTLLATRVPVDHATLTATADALGLPLAELVRRLDPGASADGCEVAVVVRSTLALAVARLSQLRDLGAPEVVVDAEWQRALRVAAAGWRPAIDVNALLPDVTEVAAQVDLDAWDSRPVVVGADITDLVLLAALCCIGADTRSLVDVDTSAFSWRDIVNDEPDEPSYGPIAEDSVVVRPCLSWCDAGVEHMAYALVPPAAAPTVNVATGALLAVTFSAGAEDP